MKLYNIFIKQNSAGKIEDIKLLKEGFSLSALIFTPFWFLYHKMWREFFAVIAVVFFAVFLQEIHLAFDANLIEIILLIIIAFNANYWLEEHLRKKQGYEFIGIVCAKNCAQAKINLVENFHLNFSDFSLSK